MVIWVTAPFFTVAVAVAPVPLPPLTVTVGTLVYLLPALVIVVSGLKDVVDVVPEVTDPYR